MWFFLEMLKGIFILNEIKIDVVDIFRLKLKVIVSKNFFFFEYDFIWNFF